jgi:hypothetical protein
MQCPHCDGDKTPEHIVFYPQSFDVCRDWPWPNKARRRRRPLTTEARRLYLKDIMAEPKAYDKFLEITGIFRPREPAIQQEHAWEPHHVVPSGTEIEFVRL